MKKQLNKILFLVVFVTLAMIIVVAPQMTSAARSSPTINASDSNGNTQTNYSTSNNVYARISFSSGWGSETLRVYVLTSSPSNGASLTDFRGSSSYNTVTATASAQTVLIWTAPLSVRTTYYLATDMDENGVFSSSSDDVSSAFSVTHIATSTSTSLSDSSVTLGGSVTDSAAITSTTYLSNQVTFVSVGSADASEGTNNDPTPSYPTGLQMNDLILLQVVVSGTSEVPTTPTGAGFAVLSIGAADTNGYRQWIYYKFTTGTENSPLTVSVSGSVMAMARMYAFKNVAASSFTEGGSFGSGTDSSIEGRTVATTDNGRLGVSFVFINDNDDVGNLAGAGGGYSWAEVLDGEFKYNGETDGTLQLQTATMASIGTISGGIATVSSSDSWGIRAFALKPTSVLPTGNVDFQVLAPGGSWVSYDNTKTLSFGSATSSSYTPNSPGTWQFRAVYAGDSNYAGSQSADNAEPLTVNPTTFAITVTQADHGVITGPSSVNWGTDAVYSIAPDDGYHIVDVIVDGLSKGIQTSWTISNVKENGHSITASFALTINPTELTISVSPNTINKYDGLYATVFGTLKSQDVGLVGYDVIISYNDGIHGWVECATSPAITGAGGVYSLEFPVTPDFVNGFVAFSAEFSGDSDNGYAAAPTVYTGAIGAEPGNLNVVPEYVIGALAAVGACFVGFVAFKKRSSLPQFRFK